MRASSFLAFTVLALLAGCSRHEVESEPYKKLDDSTILLRNTGHIELGKAQLGTFPSGVDIPGRVAIPDKDLYVLSSRVQGRVETLEVTVGDSVQPGQVIAKVWSPDLATAAEELRIAKEQNNSDLINLTYQKLQAMGLDARDANPSASSYPLRAKMKGVVLDRKVSSGAAIQPGDALLTIGKNAVYQFQGEVPPEEASKIKTGMKVQFEDAPGLTAEVEAVSPVADPVSRLMKVRCRFTGAAPRSLPQETFLKAEVITDGKQALLLPAKAMIYTDKGEFAFVQVPGSEGIVVKRVPIQVLARGKNLISVAPTADLKDGTPVVSEGALLLNDVLEGES